MGQVNNPLYRCSVAPLAVAGWTTWTNLHVSVSLLRGANLVLLRTTGASGPNLDSLEIRADPNPNSGCGTAATSFLLLPLFAAVCPPGMAALSHSECLQAHQALAIEGTFSYPANRGLVEGSWPGVPVGCSIQYADEPNGDKYVSTNQDQSPHWNAAITSDNSRVANGEFRLMCRVMTAAGGTTPAGFQQRIVECLRNGALISDDALCVGVRPVAIRKCEILCGASGQATGLPAQASRAPTSAPHAPQAVQYVTVPDSSNSLLTAVVALALLIGLAAVIGVVVYFHKARQRERTAAVARAERAELSLPVEAIPIRMAHVVGQAELGLAMHPPVGRAVQTHVAIGSEIEMQEILSCTAPQKYPVAGPSVA